MHYLGPAVEFATRDFTLKRHPTDVNGYREGASDPRYAPAASAWGSTTSAATTWRPSAARML